MVSQELPKLLARVRFPLPAPTSLEIGAFLNDRTASSTGPLDLFFAPVLGLPAWGVRQGHGSFLDFEFGQPALKVEEWQTKEGMRRSAHVTGEWHLWIYCCHWRVLQDGAELAWSESTREEIDRAAARLNGQQLSGVTVDPRNGRSSFAFDLGGVLETWPYGDDLTQQQWTVFNRGEVFGYRADGHYFRGRADTPPDQEQWFPLSRFH
jgi:hypothetical protein